MNSNKARAITDEAEPGTVSVSRSITDEAPDIYVHGKDSATSPEREAFEEDQAKRLSDDTLSGGEKAEILLEAGPDETFEERMARASD